MISPSAGPLMLLASQYSDQYAVKGLYKIAASVPAAHLRMKQSTSSVYLFPLLEYELQQIFHSQTVQNIDKMSVLALSCWCCCHFLVANKIRDLYDLPATSCSRCQSCSFMSL